MMNFFSTGIGFGFLGFHMHALFCLLVLIGIVLFVVWAARFLNRGQMKTLVIWLLTIGVIGMLLTTPFAGVGFPGMMSRAGFGWQRNQDNKSWNDDDRQQLRQFIRGMMQPPQENSSTPST